MLGGLAGRLGKWAGTAAAKATKAYGASGLSEAVGFYGGSALGAASYGLNKLGPIGSRAVMGAGVGAVAGGMSGDGGGSILGGAAMGAAGGAAFAKWGAGRNLMGKGATMLSNSNAFYGVASGRSGGRALRGGVMGQAHSFLTGTGKQFSNMHGDKVLAGLAMGSAGLIGGSAFSSNRPY